MLLDTHALLWWLTDSGDLSRSADEAVRDSANPVFVSAATTYEISQKHRLGKLPLAARLARSFDDEVLTEGFIHLPITPNEARLAGAMPHPHRDPFDRLLIAQALLNDLTLASNKRLFDDFAVARLW